MKIPDLSIFKKYSQTPVLKNCLNCKRVKPVAQLEKDVFCAKPALQKIETTVYNPYTSQMQSGIFNIDLKKPAELVFDRFKRISQRNKPVTLRYTPENTAYVYKKIHTAENGIKKQKMKVNVLTSTDGESITTYHFFTPDLKREIGYVSIADCRLLKKNNFYEYSKEAYFNKPLHVDHKKEGIVGDRIKIDYLQNWDDKKYGGIGELADRLSVEYCINNNLPLNIVSEADINSHIAHYKRGKRFFMPATESNAGDFFKNRYGTKNPNQIIKKLLSESRDARIDTGSWGCLPMYMPQELAQKYAGMAKNSPIIKDFKPLD